MLQGQLQKQHSVQVINYITKAKLSRRKRILRGDVMFIESVYRSADVVCNRDAPC